MSDGLDFVGAAFASLGNSLGDHFLLGSGFLLFAFDEVGILTQGTEKE